MGNWKLRELGKRVVEWSKAKRVKFDTLREDGFKKERMKLTGAPQIEGTCKEEEEEILNIFWDFWEIWNANWNQFYAIFLKRLENYI